MYVYIINFVVNMILGLLIINVGKKNNPNKRKKIYLTLTTIQLALLCGLRSEQVAHDTSTYGLIFSRVPNSWTNIFDHNMYFEIGFSIYCSIIKILGGSFRTMLIITSFFIIGSCCIFIYRHSKNVLLSVFIIICFPFYYSTFDIIRHFIALSFFLLGYKYILEKKFLKYFAFIAIGSLFHSISWLFLIFYFIDKVKFNFKVFIISIIIMLFSYFFISDIAAFLSGIIGKSNPVLSGWVGSYGGGTKTFIMYLFVFLISLLAYQNLKNADDEDANSLKYILILCMFSFVFLRARLMTRLIMSVIPLLSISIPKIFCEYNDRVKDRKKAFLLYLMFIIIGLAYHSFMLLTNWQNVVPYIPYWK